MDKILKRCGSASDNEVAIDLSTISAMDDLIDQYDLILVAESQDKLRVTTGHAHNHPIAPPIEVSRLMTLTCLWLLVIIYCLYSEL